MKKARLIALAGGACQLCGMDEWQGVLEWHHVDPRAKTFGLSGKRQTASFAKTLAEAAKCVLLCANCHRLTEAGRRDISSLLTNDGVPRWYADLRTRAPRGQDLSIWAKEQAKLALDRLPRAMFDC